MISQKLLYMVERHAENIADRWMKDIRQNLDTISYKKISDDKLRENAMDLFAHLSRWVKDPSEGTSWIEEIYTKRGRERQQAGFRVSEVVKAVIQAKHHLWNYVEEEGVFESATDLYLGLELLQNIGSFFDRVIYFLVLGFEREASVEAWKRP